jgi:hypothetical protein
VSQAQTDGKQFFRLSYFEDVLPYEFEAIRVRRSKRPAGLLQSPIQRVRPLRSAKAEAAQVLPTSNMDSRRPRSPDPDRLFDAAGVARSPQQIQAEFEDDRGGIDPDDPDRAKQRPLPAPCDATGLALSGGGVRSAAFCLGVLQALEGNRRLASFDYLSTVSGGGYMGACLHAAMAQAPHGPVKYPFGDGVEDSPAVAHIRDYSNYLLPRAQGVLRTALESLAILLRGWIGNTVVALTTLFLLAGVSSLVYPTLDAYANAGSVITDAMFRPFASRPRLLGFPFVLPSILSLFLSLALLGWALERSIVRRPRNPSDVGAWPLGAATRILQAILVIAVLDAQPQAVAKLAKFLGVASSTDLGWLHAVFARHPLPWSTGAILPALTIAAPPLGRVLSGLLSLSRSASGWTRTLGVGVSKLATIALAMIVPLALWLGYLLACMVFSTAEDGGRLWLWLGVVAGLLLSVALRPNAYSLHRLYRDRLSDAFLAAAAPDLRLIKLSALVDSAGPYPILNAALNIQGSREANRRGRNADFFTFTPQYVGSDLTHFAPTRSSERTGMEEIDPQLDLGTAMAISGAAFSANMGRETERWLSPTLALLNVRLGYWLRNPNSIVTTKTPVGPWDRVREFSIDKLYLFKEIFNRLDERSRYVYLTDGGHIENLGVYELLKRGCKLIVAVDAEQDPAMNFSSWQQLERYARIDFGVRIELPWRKIAAQYLAFHDSAGGGASGSAAAGPHVAVGKILYAHGEEGVIVYIKASVTGDEKDYLLDYMRRNPAFPHEATLDQFFGEEQFEAYRALGFHIVDHFFSGEDDFGCLDEYPSTTPREVRAMLDKALPAAPVPV